MRLMKIAGVLALSASLLACRSARETAPAAGAMPAEAAPAVVGNSVGALPPALIYKTSGDYRDNVPITLDAARTGIVSYPDPTDISPEMKPIPLADGYLLDRRGIAPTSAFTTYTYEQYAALEKAPASARLRASIIPDAAVTEIRKLPLSLSEAVADTALCNRLIRESLASCPLVYKK